MKKLVLLFSLVSMNALAWGPTGHRVVGHIAMKELSINALTKVSEILANQTFDRVANWPDEIKSDPAQYSHTYNWHYTDWPDEMHDHNEENSSGTLIKSIGEQVAVLKNPLSSKEQKVFALKFLVHLVGDLHMPLHVGNGQDLGGNACKVVFFGKQTNLHAVWDEGIIEATKLSYTELSRFVLQGKSHAEIASYKRGEVLDWASESRDLRKTVYPNDVKGTANHQYCRKEGGVTVEEMPVLGYEYTYKFNPVVEKRLLAAGLRLAYLINQIYQ